MSSGLIQRKPGDRLFAEVFGGKSPEEIAANAADGIQAVIGNVERIVSDLDYLRAGGRTASASFLLATADEELAKVFILIDACRLDPARREQVLRNLCKAFYDHRQKYAYNAMRRYRPGLHDRAQAWRLFTRRWWPESSDPEAGEPAMPHETYFDREMPLYVDWDYYSGKWVVPDNNMNGWKFGNDPAMNHADKLCADLGGLKVSADSKLFCADALMCVNIAWSGVDVNEKTSISVIERAEKRLVELIVSKFSVSVECVRGSALLERPLYHFTTMPADNC